MWHSSFSLVAASTSRGKISKKSVVFEKEKDNEKRSVATQTLRAGCSKADPHQTNKQTNRDDYNTLRSLARNVIINTCH